MACDSFCHRLGSCVVSARALSCMAYKTFDEYLEPSCDNCIDGDSIRPRRSNVKIKPISGSLNEYFGTDNTVSGYLDRKIAEGTDTADLCGEEGPSVLFEGGLCE